jgi:HEAT repeat protein
VAEALLAGIDRERWFQERWLAALQEALGDPKPGEEEPGTEERAALTYIAGDTCRRLDREDAAAEWFRRALRVEGAPAVFFELARTALEKLGAEGGSSEAVAEAMAKRLEELIARLNDPETAGTARREISVLRDPSLEPGVIAALGSEHPEVRSQAALALKELPEPSDAAVDALCRQLGDEEQDPRWRAAVALARIGAARSRPALERALGAERDRDVRRCVVEALGFVGTEESLPGLLDAWDGDILWIGDLRETLSRLGVVDVPKEIGTRDELEAWWKEHRPGTWADWVRAGFAAAGVEVEEPWDREDVPMLLELLSHEDALVRCAAVRLLREVTGRRLPWREIARDSDSPKARMERTAAIAEWRRGLEEADRARGGDDD